jgi:hypothetical protein
MHDDSSPTAAGTDYQDMADAIDPNASDWDDKIDMLLESS